MSKLSRINLFWKDAADDTQISRYEVFYSTNNGITKIGPSFSNHINGATFSDLIDGGIITNTEINGAGTFSLPIMLFQNYIFYIKTIDSVGQKSNDELQLGINISRPILRSELSADADACSIGGIPSIPIYINNLNNNIPQVNTSIVFNDEDLTESFNGQDKFWKVMLLDSLHYSIGIANNGLITSISESCNNIPTSLSSTNGFSALISVCNAPLPNTYYFSGVSLGINSLVYTNPDLTTLLNGNNRWYLMQYSVSNSTNYIIVQIGKDSDKGKVIAVQNYNLICSFNPCCFIGGTDILMSDFTYKKIEDILVGDEIITWNEIEDKLEPNKVINKYSPIRSDLVKIILENNIEIVSTFEHPYFILNKNWCSYKPDNTKDLHKLDVNQIQIGDCLINYNKESIKIVDILELDNTNSVKTYNLGIENNTNYYANSILVHNKTPVDNAIPFISCTAEIEAPQF